MRDHIVILALASIIFMGTAVCSIVINEVELNPPGDEQTRLTQAVQWVEIYNNDDKDVNIGGWDITTSEGRSVTIPGGTIIPALGYYIVTKQPQWLAHTDEILVLRNETGAEVNRTPSLSDTQDDDFAWTRDPDGRDTGSDSDWKFLVSSSGF